MMKYKSCNFWANLKVNFIWCLLLVVFIASLFILNDFWGDVMNLFWVRPIASKCEGLSFYIFCGAFLVMVSIYYALVSYFEKTINWHRSIFIGLLAGINILAFFSDKWTYYSLQSFPLLLVFFVPAIYELIFVVRYNYNREDFKLNDPHFDVEIPIEEDSKEEVYDRIKYADSTAKLLFNSFYPNQSFAIGITGGWGTGKTSFVNMIKKKLREKEENIVILEFQPWFCQTSQSIITDFFKIFEEKIAPYSPSLGRLVRCYSKSLSDIQKTKTGAWVNFVVSGFNTTGLRGQYLELQKRLKNLQKKIVIVIDDLDRLDGVEILEVFRLIRNTANFPYVQFIVAYDKEYVLGMMKDGIVKISNPQQYIEKIFNTEIALPKYESYIICEELTNSLVSILKDSYDPLQIKTMVHISANKLNNYSVYVIPKILRTKRDIVRFTNSFKLNYIALCDSLNGLEIVKEEVDIEDFFYLELIRYFFGDIFNVLRNNPLEILTIDADKGLYILNDDYKNKSQYLIRSKLPANNYSEDFKEKLATIDKDPLSILLEKIFKESSSGNSHNELSKICNISSYIKYFAYRDDKKAILLCDVINLVVEKDCNTIASTLKMWFKEKRENEISEKLFFYIKTIQSEKSDKVKLIIHFYKFIDIIFDNLLVDDENIADELKYQITDFISKYFDSIEIYDSNHFKRFFELLFKVYDNGCINIEKCKKVLSRIFCNNINITNFKVDVLENVFFHNIGPLSSNILYSISDVLNNYYLCSYDIESKPYVDELQDIQLRILRRYVDSFPEINILMIELCNSPQITGYVNPEFEKYISVKVNILEEQINRAPARFLDVFIKFVKKEISVYENINWEVILGSVDKFEAFIGKKIFDHIAGIVCARNYWKLYKYNNFEPYEITQSDSQIGSIDSIYKEKASLLDELIKVYNDCDNLLSELDKGIDYEHIIICNYEIEETKKKLDKIRLLNIYLYSQIQLKIELLESKIEGVRDSFKQ